MNILKLAEEKKILLAAHMGCFGGNIPPNSLQAFQLAVNYGADIVELDVEASLDGELFVLHPKKEYTALGMHERICRYPAAVVEQLYLISATMGTTRFKIARLEDALRLLKGKCIVNIDKFWHHPKEISEMVRRLGMEDQVLIKTSAKPEYLDAVEQYAPDMPFMTVNFEEDTVHEELTRRNINYIGAEVVFKTEDAPVISPEYVEKMHREGKLLCTNSMVLNTVQVFSAGHNDNVSLLEDPEKGWGWLADRGMDVILTDHLLPCRLFLEETGRRRK